jgi:hypothetical protein
LIELVFLFYFFVIFINIYSFLKLFINSQSTHVEVNELGKDSVLDEHLVNLGASDLSDLGQFGPLTGISIAEFDEHLTGEQVLGAGVALEQGVLLVHFPARRTFQK